MLNFKEELARFAPSPEVEELEDYVSREPLTDLVDIMKELMGLAEDVNPEEKST